MAATATMTSTPLNFPSSRDHTTPIRFAAAESSASPRSRERRTSAARSPQLLSTPSTPKLNAPARHSSLTPTPKASSASSDAGFSAVSQATDYRSIATFSSLSPSQSVSEAAARANRQSRVSLDAPRPDLSHLETRDARRPSRQRSERDARRDASPAAVKPTSHALYHNLALASLSTPELHLASDPMVDVDDHPIAQRGLMGWLGNKRMSESTDVLPLRSGDGYYASLGAVVAPVTERKAEVGGRRESHRERKQSSATVRREPASDAAPQVSQGSCGSTATLNAASPDASAAKTSRAEKRRSAGNDSSLRHPRTWFTRPRRWSAHSSSTPPPMAASSSAPHSPVVADDEVVGSDVSFNPSIASAATVSYNPAASGSATSASVAASAFTASAISAAQTQSSLGVDASQRGARSIQENLRGARAFLVAELSQLSPVEMGEDKKRIASLAWYTREQDAESRGLALDPTREMLEFWMSISDGVVLCLVANRIRPGAVDRIDRRDAEWVKADNISRFLRACRDYLGVRSKDLFHPLDLTDATVEGLQRAVHTILTVERVSKARGLTSPIISPIVQAVAAAVPLRISTSSSRSARTPPLTPDGSLDDTGASSDVPFPRGSTEQSSPPRGSPPRKNKVSFPITPSVQQQRQEAERILVSASTRPQPLSDDANVRARRRRSSDIAGSLLSSTRPKGGASITFADSVSRGTDEDSRMPYRDRKLSESALSLTGVAEEEMEEVLHSPISPRGKARSPSTPALERRESFGAGDEASSSSFSASPMARANSQRRISQELNLGVGSGSPGRALRTSSEFEEYRFPTQGSPVRQGPVRRHSARSYVGPSSLNPQRDSSETASAAAVNVSSSSTPVRVPFPRALSASDSPSGKRLGRHLSLNTNLASYDGSALVANGSQTPVSPRTGGPTAQRPVNYRHMRYLSDLQVPKTGQLHTARSDLSIDVGGASAVSSQISRPRYDSEVGSLYTNTIGSFTTQHDDQSLVNTRLGREPSTAPTSKHKLVVVEEGKPNVTYQMGNCIGRGQFGSVYRALNLNSGQMMAVKRIKLEGKSEDEVTQLMHEVDLLKSLAHPSVVKYEGLVRGSDVVSIILEYVENGSLLHTLKAFGNFPEKLVASYVVKILEGLNYLHDMKVVHCDLKAANILTTKNGNVKLSDFGVSLNLKAVENIKNDAIGTPNWMAPEVIELKGASTAADIWSLGCTIIELLTGKPPYGDMLAMSAMWRIVEDDCPPIPDKVSEPLRDFLSLCFNKDPTLRPSAEMLFEHHWLQQTWGGHKELRPQDSVPFLRRISADFRKVDIKSLHAAISEATMPEETSVDKTPQPRRPSDMGRSTSSPPVGLLDQRPDLFYMRSTSAPDAWSRALREVSLQNSIVQPVPGDVMSALTVADLEAAAAARRGSAGSADMLRSPSMAASNSGERHLHGNLDPSLLDLNSPHESFAEESKPHSFVKSTFSKAVACKICREPVKKHAVLCEECGLICHASCARRAPASCNLRAQLLMFAGQQAHRSSQDLLRGISPVPSLGPPLMSFTPAASPAPQSPSFGPTFKVPFSNKWKRNSRGTIEPLASPPITPVNYVPGSGGIGSSPSPTPPPADVRRRRISLLPGMGLGRARSPSPVDRGRGSASIARSFTSSQNGMAPHRANSIGYGSVSGSSSISSASQGGQAMGKTASGSSGSARYQHRETSQRASQAEAPRRTSGKGHRASQSVAVIGSYPADAGLTGSQRTAGDGAITPMPLNESERKRSRRLSAKQDCAVM